MRGPLPSPETERIETIRTPRQDVVLAIWEPVRHSSIDELDALVSAMAGNINVPWLSLHGIDPGPMYATWLTARIPTAAIELWPDLGHYPHLSNPTGSYHDSTRSSPRCHRTPSSRQRDAAEDG